MKGRRVPPHPEIAAIVRAESLTHADLAQAVRARLGKQLYEAATLIPAGEPMPERTPFQRGVLDRYQDRRRKKRGA